MRILHLLLAALLALSFNANAQLEGGLGFGIASYRGDLHDSADDNIHFFDEINPSYGLMMRYKFSETIALRGQFTYLSLTGSDTNFAQASHQTRGYSFSNDMFELTSLAEYDLLGNRRYQKQKFHSIFSPYIFAGIGVGFASPIVDFNEIDNINVSINMEADITASKTLLVLPVGLGLRYNITELVSFGVEGGLRLPISDYYDGISQAADPTTNDLYAVGNVFLTMRFSKIDTDGDGITDDIDACPEIAGKEKLQGCPDADRDGVRDSDDMCPNTRGVKMFGGCPDSDKDGIQDSKDVCPETAGLAKYNGCPDTDGDGVSDDKDTCPKMIGLPDLEGCPDYDGDGIRNKRDVCPSEYGPKSTKGCPDTDGDGISDVEDSCPDVAGLPELIGCPETKKTTIATTIAENNIPEKITFDNVYFNSNKSQLNAEDKVKLDKIIVLMKDNANYNLSILGYTDSDGLAATNKQLAARRAKICGAYFIEKGISNNRLKVQGLGEINPIANNTTAKGKALNRRVEFKLQKAK